MRFKGNYNGAGDLSLGTFFSSDIRKLVALRNRYPYMFIDGTTDPLRVFTEKVRSENTLFAVGRENKKVIGYVAFDPTFNREGILTAWVRIKRPKKKVCLRLGRLMMKYGFEELGLRRITLALVDTGLNTDKLARGMGFTFEGLIRKNMLIGGKYLDTFVFGMLKEEF